MAFLKEWFLPYKLNLPENQNKILDPEHFKSDCMSARGREEFYRWYHKEKAKSQKFNLKIEMIEYCRSDIQILKGGCFAFRQIFMDVTCKTDKYDGEEGDDQIAANRHRCRWHDGRLVQFFARYLLQTYGPELATIRRLWCQWTAHHCWDPWDLPFPQKITKGTFSTRKMGIWCRGEGHQYVYHADSSLLKSSDYRTHRKPMVATRNAYCERRLESITDLASLMEVCTCTML